jgi:hypothetical protein
MNPSHFSQREECQGSGVEAAGRLSAITIVPLRAGRSQLFFGFVFFTANRFEVINERERRGHRC